ncbi:MAG: M48 family metalloprotease [Gammaproteobacteria bacterium]|nr:M48 family metalloprotease [Gammaproteobacteria bacterium]
MRRHALLIFASLFAGLLGPVSDSAWAKKKNKAQATEEVTEFGDAALGRVYHERLTAAFGIYEDPELAAYVQALGDELAAVAPNNDYSWHFTVLDIDMVNAFALPGGYIYVTRGLLKQLNTEAQLAAVLGHEIGHVTERHAARQHKASQVVGKVTGAMAATSGGFNLGTLFGAGLVRGYGREMELEADCTGAEIIAKLGYNPDAALEVLQTIKMLDDYMAAADNDSGSDDELATYHAMLSSHPEKERRMQELVASAATTTTLSRDEGRERYLRHIDGLAIEGSTQQGVLRDNVMYHQAMNMAITFPADWEVANLPDRLMAQPPAGDALLVVRIYPQKAKRARKVKVDQFLQKRLGVRRWQNSRHEPVNGNPAFITQVPKARTPYGLRLARVAAIYHNDSVFVFNGAAEDEDRQRRYDAQFVNTIESFRPIGDDEAAQSEPIRIRTIEMPADSTLAALAGQSSFADEDLLRLLNGLYPDGEPAAGQLIKYVD